MKFTISLVFGGKCPPEEVITRIIIITFIHYIHYIHYIHSLHSFISEDNTFANITFQVFNGNRIKKNSLNIFNKTLYKIKQIFCFFLNIQNEIITISYLKVLIKIFYIAA